MHPILDLFTSFRGRISRKSWWIGFLILLGVSSALSFLINPPSFDPEAALEAYEPTIGQSLLGLALFVPMLAITIKRLNDRDQPGWVGYAWGFLALAHIPARYFGFFSDPLNPSTAEWVWLAAMTLFGIWLLIDNGFLKGTPGPNRYGPDPLAPTPGTGTGSAVPPVPMRSGRTRGVWIRDGLVGVIGCVTALFLVLPGLSIESAVTWSLERMLPSVDDLVDPNREMKTNPEAWQAFNAGKSAARDEKYEKAIEHYTQAIDAYGEYSELAGTVLMWRGHAFRNLDRNTDAIGDYSAAIAIEPDLGHRYSYRGKAYVELGQYETAIRDFDKAIGLDPTSAYFHRYRGDALRELGRHDKALAAYDKSIEAAEKSFAQFENLSVFLPTAKADKHTGEMREIRDEEIARNLVGRGRTHRDKGDLAGALREFDHALALRPGYRWAYVQRGWVYEKQGNIGKARADYEKAEELGEDDDWLKRALERVRAAP